MGFIVVCESTVYANVAEEVFVPILERESCQNHRYPYQILALYLVFSGTAHICKIQMWAVLFAIFDFSVG